MDNWTKAEDELPDDYGAYLCTGEDIEMEIVWFDIEDGWRDDYYITHWMPLPEIPEAI